MGGFTVRAAALVRLECLKVRRPIVKTTGTRKMRKVFKNTI